MWRNHCARAGWRNGDGNPAATAASSFRTQETNQTTKHKNMSNPTTVRTIRSVTAVGLCAGTALLAEGSALAQDAAAAPEKKGWESVASAGVTLTRGNSETFL